MRYMRHVDLPDEREGQGADNLYAESLETSRTTEALTGLEADAKTGATPGEAESPANTGDMEKQYDPWMETITAFIRRIDIETL
jgi:hypothetical protein